MAPVPMARHVEICENLPAPGIGIGVQIVIALRALRGEHIRRIAKRNQLEPELIERRSKFQ